MKEITKHISLILTLFSLLTSSSAAAKPPVRVDSATLEYGDSATLIMTLSIKAPDRGNTHIVLAPYITDHANTVSFAPFKAVTARKIKTRRYDRRTYRAHSIVGGTSSKITYRSPVPYQKWMEGAAVGLETLTEQCRNSVAGHISLEPTPIHNAQTPEPDIAPTPLSVTENTYPDPTTGDSLAVSFPFLLPAQDYDPTETFNPYDDERESAITVYFPINDAEIDPEYHDNSLTLNNLTAAIEIITKSETSRVEAVVIAGFSSPEGPFELNDRLAWERALAIRDYILTHTGLPEGMINLYNGSADWQGLRILINEDPDVPHRTEAIRIIDRVPIWDNRTSTGRTSELKRLAGGETYRYLARELFPRLRNGAFIRVYYTNINQ